MQYAKFLEHVKIVDVGVVEPVIERGAGRFIVMSALRASFSFHKVLRFNIEGRFHEVELLTRPIW